MSIPSKVALLSDTHPKVEALQISLIRESSVARRVSLMFSLSGTVIGLSRRAIRRANAGMGDRELKCKFVEYHYGEDLARRLRDYLDKQV